MDFFYDGQIRRYLTQFIRALSGFHYQDGEGNLVQVPVRFGTLNKQTASILRQNSENFLMQAPFISAYVENLELSRARMQDPTYVSKVHVVERQYGYTDENGQYIEDYAAKRGADVTVERLMPNPYQLSLKADIWTTNIDQKLQILEQIVVLFNPAIELQTTSNYLDWTSLTTLELMEINYTNQTIPTGDQDLEVASLKFMAPIWLSPPAKVKRQGVITSIIARVFDEEGNITNDLLAGSMISRQVITLYGYGVMITNNSSSGNPQYIAKLLGNVEGVTNAFDTQISKLGQNINWREILERYPGKFVAGYSKLQLTKADGKIATATLSLDSADETIMHLTFDSQSLPPNTNIPSIYRTGNNGLKSPGTIDAIIDPSKPITMSKVNGLRYLILEDISAKNRDYDVNQNNLISYYQDVDITEAFYVTDILASSIINTDMLNKKYTITELGTTDFTIMGASKNAVGVTFTAVRYGNGTGKVTRAGQPVDGQVLPGVVQWENFEANANDIIEWNGTTWQVVFNSGAQTGPTFITNAYTGIQYKWDGEAWTKSMEGTFNNGSWQIIL
jgi:hypothetical protein